MENTWKLERWPVRLTLLLTLVGLAQLQPELALAQCVSSFEACSNGVDDDCDGGTDEGCSTCGPSTWETDTRYGFSSLSEIRNAVNNIGANYANDIDLAWSFLPSHRMTNMAMIFSSFRLETGWDYFKIGTSQFTGTTLTDTGAIGVPNSTSLMTMEFTTDASVIDSGLQATHMWATCANSGGQYRTVPLNMGVDGVLLYSRDNATFEFTLPANRHAYINVDTCFSALDCGKDFDIFVSDTTVVSGFLSYQSFTSGAGKFSASTTSEFGDMIYIAPSSSSRTFHGNIVSWNGDGRFRAFVVSPVDDYDQGYVDVGIEKTSPTSGEIERVKNSLAALNTGFLVATDGQYEVSRSYELTKDVYFFSFYDIVFSEITQMSTEFGPAFACNGGVMHDSGVTTYIVMAGPYWKGSASWTDGTTNCCNNVSTCSQPEAVVGRSVAHEWGHFEFGILDEYASGGAPNGCGRSMMAGTFNADYDVGNRAFEFCTTSLHGLDTTNGINPVPSSANNWGNLDSAHPAMSTPTRQGDFSQLIRLYNTIRSTLSFTGP